MTDRITAVLVPDEFGGLAICDFSMLTAALEEGATMDEAVMNASFDSIDRAEDIEVVRAKVVRVRTLNVTDDSDAYWDFGAGSSK